MDEHREAGRHDEGWIGRDARGQALASGINFCRIEAKGFSETRRMTLLK